MKPAGKVCVSHRVGGLPNGLPERTLQAKGTGKTIGHTGLFFERGSGH